MGFHICQFCKKEEKEKALFSPYSSQDIMLRFANGNEYLFPHTGLLHYVTSHNYQPSQKFIDDVMTGTLEFAQKLQTKGMPESVGYLTNDNFQIGDVPEDFVKRLREIINQTEISLPRQVTHTRGL